MSVATAVERIGIGIDTARYGHYVTFVRDDLQRACEPLQVVESRDGYRQLEQALQDLRSRYPQAKLIVRVDAAGQYADNLIHFLHQLQLPLTISVGEPHRNKEYRLVHYPKLKSDKAESAAMARYAVVERPAASTLAAPEFVLLSDAAGRLQGVARDLTRALNRLHNLLSRVFPELMLIQNNLGSAAILKLLDKYPTPAKIARADLHSLTKIPYLVSSKAELIQARAKDSVGTLGGPLAEELVRQAVAQVRHAQEAKQQAEKLLLKAYQQLPDGRHRMVETIAGIGPITAAALVAKIVAIERFESAKKLVGYFGIFSEVDSSGFHKDGTPKPSAKWSMSKKGNDLVRGYLWMAALSAVQRNPAVRALYRRLRSKNVNGCVALGHCMRKLLHLVFAVWTSGKPFHPEHYPWHRAAHLDQPPAEASADANEKAAGHKREVIPDSSVVSTAESSLGQGPTEIKPSGSIDYAHVRAQITMERVLRYLGHFDMLRGRQQKRGPCPLHAGQQPNSRDFSVNLDKNAFQCFHKDCRAQGNVLDFWAALHRLPLHAATIHLAETFGLSLQPEQRRGTRK